MRIRICDAVAFVAAIMAFGCADGPTTPRVAPIGSPADSRGDPLTSSKDRPLLEVSQTALGFLESRQDYDWTLTKEVFDIMDEDERGMFSIGSTTNVEIPRRQVRWIDYKIVATRGEGTTALVRGVRGEICVKNNAASPTTGLKIIAVVQAKTGSGSFTDVMTTETKLGAHSAIAAGERRCYPYELTLPLTTGATYRVTARVTTVAASGKSDTKSYAPATETAFSIPATATAGAPIDAEAVIVDGMDGLNTATRSGPCAEHFYLYWCTSNTDDVVWQASGSRTIMFMVDMHNNFACGDAFDFTNTAVLVEGGSSASASGTRRTASATLHITTPPCAPAPDACTLTQGYWKQTHHLWPDETVLGHRYRHWEFFTSGKVWQQILDTPARGDAYIILAHQYIAATLNQANGARLPSGVVDQAYKAAAHYFATPELAATTSRQTLIGWADVLASFNEGKQGVPHCK